MGYRKIYLAIDCRSDEEAAQVQKIAEDISMNFDIPAKQIIGVTSSRETINLVDKRWSEYGIGEFIESPSSHYRKLLLSDTDQW